MRKEKFTRIAIIVLSLMILLVAIAFICMVSALGDANRVKVKLTCGITETISFNDPDLGDRKEEYTVSLLSEEDGDYKVSFSFFEANKNKHRDDIYAKIVVDGRTVCDSSLASLFDGGAVSFDCRLAKKEATDVKVVYYIPRGRSVKIGDGELNFDVNILANN